MITEDLIQENYSCAAITELRGNKLKADRKKDNESIIIRTILAIFFKESQRFLAEKSLQLKL